MIFSKNKLSRDTRKHLDGRKLYSLLSVSVSAIGRYVLLVSTINTVPLSTDCWF